MTSSTVLSASEVMSLRSLLIGRDIALCFGGGVDSTAMLVALKEAGIVPHVITFADTGGEKRQTYEHVSRMQSLLKKWGFPDISIVRHITKSDTPYNTLEGNCTANETLPSLAFGMKSCSIKWKQGPQDRFLKGALRGQNKCPPHPIWVDAQRTGKRIVKLIGYDSGKADIRRSKNLPTSDSDFDYLYPLQHLGWTRPDCVKAIVAALGPAFVPIKSACFYCPASKPWELFWLAANEPELFERALHMERTALTGRHSRFDELHFGDTWENLVRNAPRFPSSNTSVGLGRKFAWNHWARLNGIVDENFRVKRELSAHFSRMSDKLRGDDNALDMRSCA